MLKYENKSIGGILLVSGTAIGAGMLALPVMTGFSGFFPSLAVFIVFWIYMTFTALLMLEVNLSMEPNTNLITMARNTLGKPGELIAWIVYLFLLYALTTAYIAATGWIVVDLVETNLGKNLPIWMGSLLPLMLFGLFVYRGLHSVDFINRILMVLMTIAFIFLCLFLAPHVETEKILHRDWFSTLSILPIVATSFGFHIIIPSLATYMERDSRKLARVIWIGSFIPLAVYALWELFTLGILPIAGPFGICEGFKEGANGAYLLAHYLSNPWIMTAARIFSFFAIATSFLGVSLSLTDFLADGLKIQKTKRGRCVLFCLTFIPPLLVTFLDPRAFLTALEYAGAFGVVILLGLLPALMVLRGRYQLHLKSIYRAPGGKIALWTAAFFSLTVMLIELANKAGILPKCILNGD